MVRRRQGLICTISFWGDLFPLFNLACGVASLSLWPGIEGTEHIRELAEEGRKTGATKRAMRSLASQAN